MKILLVNPPSEMLKQEGFVIMPPLGLLYIGAVLEKAGHQVKIVDCVAQNWKNPQKFKKGDETIYRFDVEKDFWSDLFSKFQPELIGIANLFATSENICLDLANKLKNYLPQIKIIIGGTNASPRAKFFLERKQIDFVIRGEGEYAVRDLVKCLENNQDYSNIKGFCYKKGDNVFINPTFSWIENLDELPFPAYHLLTCSVENYFHGFSTAFCLEKRVLSVATSRGCINNCVFCSGMKNLGRWRARSPENVIAELSYLKENFNIKEIAFVEPNIGLDKNRFIELLTLMKAGNLNLKWTPSGGIYVQTFSPDLVKLMWETGCHSMNLAVEHGDPRMQQYIGKIVPLEKVKLIMEECKKFGIWVNSNFVLGLPGETKESLERCLEYGKNVNFDSISFTIATPLPGSRLYEELLGRKELQQTENLRFLSKKIWWTEMDPDYLKAVLKRFMMTYVIFKIINEFKPSNIFFRIKNFKLTSMELYLRVVQRFLKILFFS